MSERKNYGAAWAHHIRMEFNEEPFYEPRFHFYYWRDTQEFGFLTKNEESK